MELEASLDRDVFCDHGYCDSIHKAILVTKGGLIEIHGKQKMAWTHLNEHLFANNQPVPYQSRKEVRWHIDEWGPRLVLHVFSTEGDLKVLKSFRLDGQDKVCSFDCSYCLDAVCLTNATVTDIKFFFDRIRQLFFKTKSGFSVNLINC